MKKVRVDMGKDSYDIHIGEGLLGEAGPRLTDMGYKNKAVVITDATVAKLYGQTLVQSLEDAGLQMMKLVIQPGETTKTLDTAAGLYTRLADANIERNTPVLALGGGVTGDLTGFVAATYLRGLPLIQIPTTLLAQVDSSIGGKTAVDHAGLKNIIGAFYQPRLVLADLSVLKSLDARQVTAGLAEVIKYGAIKDSAFFHYIEDNIENIKAFDMKMLERTVFRAAQIKGRIVQQDEKDTGLRHLLNFGHTVGHAVESVSNFSLGHGEAIAIGMLAAGEISLRMGQFDRTGQDRLRVLVRKAGLPVKMPSLDIDEVMRALTHDKKKADGKIKFVLLKAIGKAFVSDDISPAIIEHTLRELYENT